MEKISSCRIFTCFLSSLCFLHLPANGLAQGEIRSDQYDRLLTDAALGYGRKLEYTAGLKGPVEASIDGTDGNMLAHFLVDRVVERELELTPSEQRRIESSFAELIKAIHSPAVRDDGKFKGGTDESHDGPSEIENPISHFLSDIKGILGRKRYERLIELLGQSLFLSIGLEDFVNVTGLSVSSRESSKRDMFNEVRKLESDLLEKAQERELAETNRLFNTILESVEKDLQSVVRDRWKHVYCRPGGLAILYLHLQRHSDVRKDVEANDLWGTLGLLPEVKASVFFEPFFSAKSKSEMSELNRLNMLGHAILSPTFQRRLDVVDNQLDEFRNIMSEYQEYSLVVNRDIGVRLGCPVNRIVRIVNGENLECDVYYLDSAEAMAEYSKKMNSVAKEYVFRIESIFVDNQKQAILDEIYNLYSMRLGIGFDLVDGTLAKTHQDLIELDDPYEFFQNLSEEMKEENYKAFVSDLESFFDLTTGIEGCASLRERLGSFPDSVFYDRHAISRVWGERVANDVSD